MLWHTTKDGKYRIESMSTANFPAALEVARTCFQDETVCIGTGVDKDPLAAEEMLELCADAALDGLSLVAVATDTEEVAATVFCKLQEKPTTDSTEKTFFEIFSEERCKRPASCFMMEFMIEVDEKCNYFERCGVDCCCEIMFVGTLPHHRRKGLATLLVKTAVELVKKFKDGPIAPLTILDLGPKYAFMKPKKPVSKSPQLCTALWSAVGSKRIGQVLGFSILETFSFADFVYDGVCCSDRIGAVVTCECAVLKI
ncbi:hypothetical protein PYW08_013505 [Mythimna loreyi]|uniref:Uncharacterized protein n=1 Tax=Mythimna loreyi TaxID=667449 RepID=A0ACC2QHQ7_9NEOP|nr:hypothetical protein PYW08_013505 [Mythimna loreyi]